LEKVYGCGGRTRGCAAANRRNHAGYCLVLWMATGTLKTGRSSGTNACTGWGRYPIDGRIAQDFFWAGGRR
jgi:hypothetical protein